MACVAEDAADRRGRRREAAVGPHAAHLVEHLVEPVGGAERAQAPLDAGHERHGHARQRGAQGHLRRDRRRALGRIAQLGLDRLRDLPGLLDVHPALDLEARQRLQQQLGGHAVREHGDRVGGGRDGVGAGARGLDRDGQRRPAGALGVEPDGHAGGLPQARRRARPPRNGSSAPAGSLSRIRSAPRAALRRALSSRWSSRVRQPAVDEADVQAHARLAHGLGRARQVVDVVERVVQPEDVDARLGRAEDEAAHEVGLGGLARRPGTCRAAPSRAACGRRAT